LFHGPEPLPARDVAGFSGPVTRPCPLPGKFRGLGGATALRQGRGLEIRRAVTFDVCVGRAGSEAFGTGTHRRHGLAGPLEFTAALAAPLAAPRSNRGASPASSRRLRDPRLPCDGTELVGSRRQAPFRASFDLGLFKILFLEAGKRSGGRLGRRGRGRPAAPATTTWFPANEGVGCETFPEGLLALFLRPVCLGHAWRGAMRASLFRLVLVGGWRRLGKPGSLGAAGREVRIKRFGWSSWSPAWFFGLDLAEFALAVAFPVEIPFSFPVAFSFSIRIPVPPDCLGPGGRLGFQRAVRGLLQAGSRRFERGRFGGRGRRLVGGVSLITQSLAEPAGHFGSIAAPAHGPVRALTISVRALTVSVSVLAAGWSRKRGGKRLVGRFGS
jgi:hypothetical protein